MKNLQFFLVLLALANPVFSGLIDFTFRSLSKLLPIDREAFMTAPEMIRYNGYPCEIHNIETEDGYILETHRIPYGRNGVSGKNRVPVIMTNDIFMSSSHWVFNKPEGSLGFILADEGYDVWLLNHRGNTYSKKHAWLNPKSAEFWRFTLDEFGMKDIPAAIDYVRNATQFEKVHLMGYFMSAPALPIALSTRPEYNDKVRLVTGFSPCMSMNTSRVIFHPVIGFARPVVEVLEHIIHPEVAYNSEMIKFFMRAAGYFVPELMKKNFLIQTAVSDGGIANLTRFPVYMSNIPEGSSIYLGQQVLEWVADGYVRRYDWGKKENIKRYGTPEVEEYPLHKISAPFLLVTTPSDILVTNEDVEYLARQIQNPIVLEITEPHYSHVTFILAPGPAIRHVVYDKVIKVMREHDEKYVIKHRANKASRY